MELKVISDSGQASQTVQVSDVVFGREYNEPLIHQLVVAYQANARQGTRQQKDRSEVRASTRKPWKQKGTGRARQGSRRAAQWVGGGRIHTPHPRSIRRQGNRSGKEKPLPAGPSQSQLP